MLVFSFAANAQGAIKNIGNTAKSKLEGQDFNSSRSNKEKTKLRNEGPGNAPASAPAPPPPTPESDTVKEKSTVTPPAVNSDGYQSDYTFDKTVKYNISDLKKTDKPAEEITYSYSDGALMTKMSESSNLSIITDFANEVSITFDEKNRTATVMSTKWMTNMASKLGSESEVTVTKTGNSKDIIGYNCDEYIITDKKSKTECWITTAIEMDYAKTIQALTKQKADYVKGDDFPAKALMMEMKSYNKKGEAETLMTATSYADDTSVKSLSGYSVTSLMSGR